jgi:DNA-binding MarR family transcriptional regulator
MSKRAERIFSVFENLFKSKLLETTIDTDTSLFRLIKFSDEGCVRMSDISKHFNVSKPAATQAVERLEKKGLVYRASQANDKRVVLVKLTPEGEKQYNQTKNETISVFESIVKEMGEDGESFTSLMEKFMNIIDENIEKFKEMSKRKDCIC